MKEVVLEAGGLLRGSSAPALETFLRRHEGIHHAGANYMSDTVTVGFDEMAISEEEIRGLIEECGYHCRGEVMPKHVCSFVPGSAGEHCPPVLAHEHFGHVPLGEGKAVSGEAAQIAHEMGHGAGMSMEEMVRDIRRRFWITFVLIVIPFLSFVIRNERTRFLVSNAIVAVGFIVWIVLLLLTYFSPAVEHF